MCVIANLFVVQDVDVGVYFDVIVVGCLFRRDFVAYRKVGRYEEKWRYFRTLREIARLQKRLRDCKRCCVTAKEVE